MSDETTSADSLYEDVWSAIFRNQDESDHLDIDRIIGVLERIKIEVAASYYVEEEDAEE